MNFILEQLLSITGRLEPPSGVPADGLGALRRNLAASLIQQNPSALPIVPDPAVDPAINEAATSGAALAAEMTQSGIRLRVVRDSYVTPAPTPGRPTQVFGPFVDADGSLVRFAAFENSRFLTVQLAVPAPFPFVQELLLLLPAETSTNDGNRTFSIPAGTVWIRARLLVVNTPGYVGMRVAGGSLQIDRPALPGLGRRISVAPNMRWTLVLEPEQPAPADASGSDANALTVQLPTRLEVRSTGAPTVNGAIAMSGFGADLEFANPAGGPIADAASIAFPYDTAGALWSIDGNLSAATQFAGECPVISAAWSLPLTQASPSTFGEAAHGGSLSLCLVDKLESRLPGASGVFRWFDVKLTANGQGIELDARQAESSARVELDLWTPARADAVFARKPIARLLFSSRRGGPDVALVSGGQLRNRWDLPLTAAGEPFPYEGAIELFAVIAEATGLLRITCAAIQHPKPESHGVTLENLYLLVRLPRKQAFTGDYDGVSRISDGKARLFFDVMLAQPSLPDPYAASWPLPDEIFVAEDALSIALRWAEVRTPTVEARLEHAVRFPEPRDFIGDEDQLLRDMFDRQLGSQFEVLSMLDLSSNDHHFGVALETLSDQQPQITENRLTIELRDVRLLMQPQVQWEPVQVEPNPAVNVNKQEIVRSATNGGRTLAGADSVKLVPVLPGIIGMEIVAATYQNQRAGYLFSLPFGLRAFVRIDPIFEWPFVSRPVLTGMHQPRFDDLTSAQRLLLIATGGRHFGAQFDPSRGMPGAMHPIRNLTGSSNPTIDAKKNVLADLVDMMSEFKQFVPLHRADLSGYGLSAFSDWRQDVEGGISQVRFDVLIGRTSYEVIQARSILACCLAHVVRTIIFERRNSGRVLRFDSGWQAIDDGKFRLPDLDVKLNIDFEKGVVKAFSNIRNIRILEVPTLTLSDASVWQPVLYDADAELEDVVAGGTGGRIPIRDHAGYIQIQPTGKEPKVRPDKTRILALFQKVGKPIGGPIDGTIRVGRTLEMHLAGIFACDAPDDTGFDPGFVVAAYGSPKLPRAGQWSAVRLNGATLEASPVDPRYGIPVIQRGPNQPYLFRDPADARRTKRKAEYGFLMTTPTSRVLFPRPAIDAQQVGLLATAGPMVADPYSLVQATSAFPRPSYALRCKELPVFNISADNQWRLTNPNFTYDQPALDLAKGGEWAINRAFPPDRKLNVLLDSAIESKSWEIGSTPNDLNIDIPPFGTLFTIHTNYHAVSGGLPKLETPTLLFGDGLKAVKDVIDSLNYFKGLANFNFDVDVTAGTGPSPSFIVSIKLKFRIGEGPNERIDIGVGKFYGEFNVRGELEVALSGKTRGLLSAEFQGDVQQGILPPLLYAGGLFRFAIQINETGRPVIELGLGVTASIGGDLIKGLLEVEVTVKYGYTLIPEKLQPGVLLGLEARAKLLGGLVGFSFAVQAMARIQRLSPLANEIDIWAEIRVAASVQIAWLIEEDVDFQTQFEQRLPLALVAAAAFMPALAPAAALL